MKNILKRKKFDKVIKKDVLVRVWNYESNKKERYLSTVYSKHSVGYAYGCWKGGETAKEHKYFSNDTEWYKHAELVEPEVPEDDIQLVWVWDNPWKRRVVMIFNYNKNCFYNYGLTQTRGLTYENTEPFPLDQYPQWAIDAIKEIKAKK